MTTDELHQWIRSLDQLCYLAESRGLSGQMIAGTLLARVQHWYLKDNEHDIDGLVKLCEYSIENLKRRPKFDIE
jgi:hypothetical protein